MLAVEVIEAAKAKAKAKPIKAFQLTKKTTEKAVAGKCPSSSLQNSIEIQANPSKSKQIQANPSKFKQINHPSTAFKYLGP